MTTHCFIPVLGKRLRATTLDNCGLPPAVGVTAAYVATDGFITITLSAEVEDGTEIITRKASGALCVNEKYADSFKRFTVEIEFCGVNPSLLSIVSNAKPYTDYAGDIAGFTVPEGAINKKFALELWTGLSGQACAPGQSEASGYLLLPFVNAGVLGDITIDGENAVTFSVTGAYTKGGNQWGKGPYGVVYNATAAVNEVQSIAITGVPTGGTFTLAFSGQQTTAIPYNATAAAVQTALQALSNVGPTGVVVTGGPGPATPYTLTFSGAPLSGKDIPQVQATHAFTGGASPAINVSTTTQGAPKASVLPTALDPFDHLLLIDTGVAPPPSACDPAVMPAPPA